MICSPALPFAGICCSGIPWCGTSHDLPEVIPCREREAKGPPTCRASIVVTRKFLFLIGAERFAGEIEEREHQHAEHDYADPVRENWMLVHEGEPGTPGKGVFPQPALGLHEFNGNAEQPDNATGGDQTAGVK